MTNLEDDEEEVWLSADFYKLSSILRNLLSNAVKFTARGGVVRCVASLVARQSDHTSSLTGHHHHSHSNTTVEPFIELLQIIVTDSGPGLSAVRMFVTSYHIIIIRDNIAIVCLITHFPFLPSYYIVGPA